MSCSCPQISKRVTAAFANSLGAWVKCSSGQVNSKLAAGCVGRRCGCNTFTQLCEPRVGDATKASGGVTLTWERLADRSIHFRDQRRVYGLAMEQLQTCNMGSSHGCELPSGSPTSCRFCDRRCAQDVAFPYLRCPPTHPTFQSAGPKPERRAQLSRRLHSRATPGRGW